MFSHRRDDFGDGFVFGAATAAYQIEGGQTDGRGPSIWDSFAATPGNVVGRDTGRIACDHYNRWEQDLDLLEAGGFDAYRFSFAWPRLLPAGTGAVNQEGVAFYDRLLDGMLERGLRPFATLYHWDLPSALQDKGGWRNRDIADWFADYADLVARHFGDRLETVATINEPWCVAFLSHYLGIHAPGHRDIRSAARASHHVLLAHGKAIAALRASGLDNLGIVLNYEVSQPATDAPEDATAARLWDGIFNRWYLDGVLKGQYPPDVLEFFGEHMPDDWVSDLKTIGAPVDWLGVNYYTRSLQRGNANPKGQPFGPVAGPREKTDMGWEIYPDGLRQCLVRIARDYPHVPLYVTENGMADVQGTSDPRRVEFFDDHLRAVIDARAEGADIRGYFAWSLLDNYEWAEGYAKRFGIVDVDYRTQVRTPKKSYDAFRQMLLPGREARQKPQL